MDRVLVVTPTKERPKMCARATKSLKSQTHARFGCVIVHNGTKVGPVEYEKALGDILEDSRFFMVSKSKAGLGYALNVGLKNYLEGYQYWAVLEDDDEWDSNFLKEMVSAADTSGADVVHCLQRQEPRRMQSPGGPMDPDALKRLNWVNWPMCLFKADVYARIGKVAENVGPATDWDWHLRCTAAGLQYHFLNKELVTHHWHQSNYCLAVDGKQYIAKKMAEGAYDEVS